MNGALSAFHSNDARSDTAWSRLRKSQVFVRGRTAHCKRAGTLHSKRGQLQCNSDLIRKRVHGSTLAINAKRLRETPTFEAGVP